MKKLLLILLLSGCSVLEKKETFAVCRAGDAATTSYLYSKGATELNPLMASILHSGGIPLFLLVQFGITYYMLEHAWKDLPEGAKAPINALNCVPVIWNSRFL